MNSTPCQFQWCGNNKSNQLPFYCEPNLTYVPRTLLINTPCQQSAPASHHTLPTINITLDSLHSVQASQPDGAHILTVNISAPLAQSTCQAMRTLKVKLPPNYADHHAFHTCTIIWPICHSRHILPSLLGNKPNFHTSGTSGTQLQVEKTNQRSDHLNPHHHHNQIKIVHHFSYCGTRTWGLWEAPADRLSSRKVFNCSSPFSVPKTAYTWPNQLLGVCGKHLLINCLRAKWWVMGNGIAVVGWDNTKWTTSQNGEYAFAICIPEPPIF